MRTLLALILSFLLVCGPVEARPSHGGIVNGLAPSGCVPVNSSDGCANSQAHGSSGVNAAILTNLNGGTPYPSATPWNVPGRDYPVGYDTTMTLTPAASWTPPASYHCNLSGHTWNCTAATATCGASCIISGIDFNDYRLVFNGAGGTGSWTITNNHFENGPDIALANGDLISLGNNSISANISYNEFDGQSATYCCIAGIGSNSQGPSQASPITITVDYNYFHNIPARAMNINGTNVTKNVNWNIGVDLDQDSFTAQNVSIDSVGNTMTVTGPFITTGGNLIHSGFSDCIQYTAGTFTGGTAGVTGTVGSQISGTPGGFGVYNFTGATGSLTNATIACGTTLHGEFDGMAVATNSQQNLMNYIGNLVAYGQDCTPLNTGLIVFLTTNGNYSVITSGSVSYNTLINKVSGNGTWGGCAAHAVANNGFIQYGDLLIQNNYVDPTNESGPDGSTSTSCFFNPGGITFNGSQSGSVLTTTSVSLAGPLPLNTNISQGASIFGVIQSQISVNPSTGVGTYQMSDSRTQTYTTAGAYFAPNEANDGSIPYAPNFSGNVNMLLAGGSNAFAISDAKMTTSAGCHT